MKNVLVLAAFYPPYPGVAPRRMESFVRHMPSNGWMPHVVTLNWNKETLARVDSTAGLDVMKYIVHKCDLPSHKWFLFVNSLPRPLKCAMDLLNIKNVCNYLRYRWRYGSPINCNRFMLVDSMRFLDRYIKEHEIDLIVSTAPDLAGHYLAAEVKQRFGISWVADCRDNYAVVCPHGISLESSLLSSANVVTTVSRGVQMALEQRLNREVLLIENGFEPDFSDVSPDPVLEADEFFNLVYTGRFADRYPDRHDPDLTMRAISEVVAEDPDFFKNLRVRIYGESEEELAPLLQIMYERYPNLRSHVLACGVVDRGVALRIQQEANILLLLADPKQKGILTGKVFEYLATRNPVLCLPGDGDDLEALLNEAQAGYVGRDLEAAKEFICNHYRRYIDGKPRVQTTSVEVLKRYRRDVLTKRLCSVMERVKK